MKFKLGEIKGMKDPLSNLLDKEIPIRTAWKFNRLIKFIDKELSDIEDLRISLVKKYGEESENGSLQVSENKMDDFVKEFNELLSQEIDIDFDPIDIDVFGDINISPKDMLALDRIFK